MVEVGALVRGLKRENRNNRLRSRRCNPALFFMEKEEPFSDKTTI